MIVTYGLQATGVSNSQLQYQSILGSVGHFAWQFAGVTRPVALGGINW